MESDWWAPVLVRAFGLAVTCGAASLAVGCGQDRWRGTAYPDRSNLPAYKNLGEFVSLDDCRANAIQYLRDTGHADEGDYECGKNCKLGPGTNPVYICEDTLR